MCYSSSIPISGFNGNSSQISQFPLRDMNEKCSIYGATLLPASPSLYNPLTLFSPSDFFSPSISFSTCPISLNGDVSSVSSNTSLNIADRIKWENIGDISNNTTMIGEGIIIYPTYVVFSFLLSTAVTVVGIVGAILSYAFGYKNAEVYALGLVSVSMLVTWGSALRAASIKEKTSVSWK